MAQHSEFEDFDQIDRRLRQAHELPFSDLLKPERVARVLSALGGEFRERVYTPAVTLWMFLSQTLSADHSCQEAVARLLAWRVARGKSRCSGSSGHCGTEDLEHAISPDVPRAFEGKWWTGTQTRPEASLSRATQAALEP